MMKILVLHVWHSSFLPQITCLEFHPFSSSNQEMQFLNISNFFEWFLTNPEAMSYFKITSVKQYRNKKY